MKIGFFVLCGNAYLCFLLWAHTPPCLTNMSLQASKMKRKARMM